MIYISHRLGEVEQIADRAVVLRDGRNAGELAHGEIRHENMVALMVGRKLEDHFVKGRGTQEARLISRSKACAPAIGPIIASASKLPKARFWGLLGW